MIFLIGASGHAKVIAEILELQGLIIGGISDANPNTKTLFEYHVGIDFPESFDNVNDKVLICVGNNLIRKRIAHNCKYNFHVAIHPRASISARSSIGSGTVVMSGTSINTGVKIGDHAIINTNASIDHDCLIGDYVHLSPNSALAGNVIVGEGSHIGIGACIIQGIKIGRWATIGAGSVIINDIPDYAVVVGNPGRIIKYNTKDEG